MKSFSRLAFVAMVVLQLLLLGGMIARRAYLLRTGKVVLLQCEPVDPRSLFSGDYVILNYGISRLDLTNTALNPNKENFLFNDRIYVALRQQRSGKFWEAVEVAHDLEFLRERYPVVLRGVCRNYQRVRYGVEQYFVPQFQGLAIERDIRRRQVAVELAVATSGESAVKRLFIAGQEVKFY